MNNTKNAKMSEIINETMNDSTFINQINQIKENLETVVESFQNKDNNIESINVLSFFTNMYYPFVTKSGNKNGTTPCLTPKKLLNDSYSSFFYEMSKSKVYKDYTNYKYLTNLIDKHSKKYIKELEEYDQLNNIKHYDINNNNKTINTSYYDEMSNKFKGNIFEIITSYYIYKYGAKHNIKLQYWVGCNDSNDDGIDGMGKNTQHNTAPVGINVKFRTNPNDSQITLDHIKRTLSSNLFLKKWKESGYDDNYKIVLVTNLLKKDLYYKITDDKENPFIEGNNFDIIDGEDIFNSIGNKEFNEQPCDFWLELSAIMYNIINTNY